MFTLAFPMPTLLLRALILLVAFYGFGEYGVRPLRDGLTHRGLVTLRVPDVPRLARGEWYVTLTGVSDGAYVYEAPGNFNTDDSGQPVELTSIEYALLPAAPPATRSASTEVTVVVQDRRIDPNCQRAAGGCVALGERTVTGVLRVGEGRVPDVTRQLLERGGVYRVAPAAALLAAGETPAPLWFPVLVMVGCALVIFVVAVSVVPGVRLW